jgi:hypothetical protein
VSQSRDKKIALLRQMTDAVEPGWRFEITDQATGQVLAYGEASSFVDSILAFPQPVLPVSFAIRWFRDV